MTKTTQLLTRPAPGTIVKPVYEYDEGQKEKLQALREVSLCCILDFLTRSPPTYLPSHSSFSLGIVVRLLAPTS
jgi:hypothetical protein